MDKHNIISESPSSCNSTFDGKYLLSIFQNAFLLPLCQAPAAFGLVSFLMHAGLERNRIRKHLLVFALAAPVLAMLTFLGLSQVSSP